MPIIKTLTNILDRFAIAMEAARLTDGPNALSQSRLAAARTLVLSTPVSKPEHEAAALRASLGTTHQHAA